jgi:hypothetical protein
MTLETPKYKNDELMINSNNNNIDYRINQSDRYHSDEKWEVQEVKKVVNIWEIYYYYYYYCYSALGPVWAQIRAQSGDWYGSGTLHPGQVLRGSLPLLSPRLDFPTFATRCFHVRHDTRDPRGGTVGENVVR